MNAILHHVTAARALDSAAATFVLLLCVGACMIFGGL